MKKPQIKLHFRVEMIEPKNVYLLGEALTIMATYLNFCCCNLSFTQAISGSDKAGIGERL
ncbi:hypothetical protein [uncultured Nostoc sp.]|uniref:hypothetical protein n=1 Tax=uncultured Nostoc sp. TaxID=340711 RepID=UPI0035CB3E0C